ncbi:unnamed protein product [Notodromas monacha]|uniref:Uncharacterized protein n=1 Tax=Notodromas monacha TaxID=399045 RepID=A0A7R9BHQ1_9CRUS|nr:unnamed protein product [Notodromas monacha]CAG0914656.1 unnamed protein product [Notodromas monacha]
MSSKEAAGRGSRASPAPRSGTQSASYISSTAGSKVPVRSTTSAGAATTTAKAPEPDNNGSSGGGGASSSSSSEEAVSLSRILSKPVREPSFFLGVGTSTGSGSGRLSDGAVPPSTANAGDNANGHGGVLPPPGVPDDYLYFKNVVPQLKRDLKERDIRIAGLELECNELKRHLKRQDVEKMSLAREVHKLKTPLFSATTYPSMAPS